MAEYRWKLLTISVSSVQFVPLIPWNGTRPMIRANRYCRSAPVTGKSGQSQFAPLKLRSLALVTVRCLIDVKFTLYYQSPRYIYEFLKNKLLTEKAE